MIVCDFCGKNHKEVYRLIASPTNVHMCDECVELSMEIITKQQHENAATDAEQKGDQS